MKKPVNTKSMASASAGAACFAPLQAGASAEEARLHALGERYASNLLVAAKSNVKLGEWMAARRQSTELMELQHLLMPSVVTAATGILEMPEVAAAGLAHKRRSEGQTTWAFDASDDDEEHDPVPAVGVQQDQRSVCPLVRTPSETLDEALRLAHVSASDVLADLGCGDGRLLVRAARLGAHAVGFDVNDWCLRRSREAAARAGVAERVEVIDADICSLDGHPRFEAASVVYVYLIPRILSRLRPLLCAAVARGQRVVVFCTSGNSAEPGNALGLAPAAQALGGLLRLYQLPRAGERALASTDLS